MGFYDINNSQTRGYEKGRFKSVGDINEYSDSNSSIMSLLL